MSAPAGPSRWRGGPAWALLLLACLLAPVALVAGWARGVVLDTDRYVATVAPLADETEVREAVAATVGEAIASRLGPVPGSRLVGAAVERATREVVESEAFADLWSGANRLAHGQVVAVLTGEGGEALREEDGVVVLNLGPVVASVEARLADASVPVPAAVADLAERPELAIVASDEIADLQRWTRLLDRLGFVLPVVVLAALAASVAVAPGRRRALGRAGVGLAVAMAVGLLALPVARRLYLDALGPEASRTVAAAVFDVLVARLRDWALLLLALGAVVGLGSFLLGLVGRRAGRGGQPVSSSGAPAASSTKR